MGLFSAAYGMALSCRRLVYTHLKKPRRLPCAVLSVGNLTLGGTGKTPAVMALARESQKRGHHPCILTRGYGGKKKGIRFISLGSGPLMTVREAGDEPYLMAGLLEGIPIVAGRKRYESGLTALKDLAARPSLFILDDGFQHWDVHRDCDILLVDATNPFGNGRLFPEGILREPLSSMKRADIIVLTKSDFLSQQALSALTEEIGRHNRKSPVFRASHRPVCLIASTGEERELSVLKTGTIVSFAGIANPTYFQETLKNLGAANLSFRKFRDHYQYRQRDIDRLSEDAGEALMVTTEKDLVKLKALNLPENLLALRVDFTLEASFHDLLFEKLSPERL